MICGGMTRISCHRSWWIDAFLVSRRGFPRIMKGDPRGWLQRRWWIDSLWWTVLRKARARRWMKDSREALHPWLETPLRRAQPWTPTLEGLFAFDRSEHPIVRVFPPALATVWIGVVVQRGSSLRVWLRFPREVDAFSFLLEPKQKTWSRWWSPGDPVWIVRD